MEIGGYSHVSGSGRRQQDNKVRDMVHQLSVPLDKMYTGFTKNLKIKRFVLCSGCDGVGGKKDSVTPCTNCSGHGVEIHHVEIAPGFVQRTQRACVKCQGEGEIIKDVCKVCNGKKRVSTCSVFVDDLSVDRHYSHLFR